MTKKKKEKTDNGFIGRRDILRNVHSQIKKGEAAIVLKGPSGVGKSYLLTRLLREFQQKKYTTLMIRGVTSAEMFLKKIAEKASEKGIEQAKDIFTSPVEYKEKLKKLLDHYIYKEKLLLVFEDFDENQTLEGAFLNERLKELLLYLKDELKEKDSTMIFCTRQEIPKFTALAIEPFTWPEFLRQISTTTALKRLKEKSLKSFHFEMGGYPRAVELFEKIAHQEFKTQSFDWARLRERVPNLTERILHKSSESADFSYLVVQKLLDYLNPRQRQLLNTLVIYRGWVARDALSTQPLEIKPGDWNKLEKLALIDYIPRKGMFYVPRLTAQIARGKMEEAEHRQKHLCAAKYFETLISTVDEAGAGGESHRQYDENALEARWHYVEAGHIETAAALTFGMDFYFSRIGFPQFAFDLVQEMEKHAPEMPEAQQIHLHLRLATFYSLFGKLDDALKHHEACLKLHQARENLRGTALNLGQMGMIYEAKGKYDEALEHFEKSLHASEALGENVEIARRLDQIGSLHKRQGNYDKSFEIYQRALPLNEQLGNRKEVAVDLEQMGRIHDEQGKFDVALDYYQKSLALRESLEDKPGIAALVHQMGNVHFFKGNLEESFGLYQRSLEIKEETGDLKGAGYSLGQIGLIHQRKGSSDEALAHFEKSLARFEEAKEEKGVAASHHQIGRIHESRGQLDDALSHYEKALELREKSGDMLGAAITYGQLGMLYFQKEEYEVALRYSTQAFAIFSRYGSPNAELARKNMLRLREKLPREKFNDVLKEFNIKTEADPSPASETRPPEKKENQT